MTPRSNRGALNPYLTELKTTTPAPMHRPSPKPHSQDRAIYRKRMAGVMRHSEKAKDAPSRTG